MEHLSCIYKITFINYPFFYIGWTNNLENRKKIHKKDFNYKWQKHFNKLFYQICRDNKLSFNEFIFWIIENCENLTTLERRIKENNYILQNKNNYFCFNKNRAFLWDEDLKEYIKTNHINNVKKYQWKNKIYCEVCKWFIHKHVYKIHEQTNKHINNITNNNENITNDNITNNNDNTTNNNITNNNITNDNITNENTTNNIINDNIINNNNNKLNININISLHINNINQLNININNKY